jgi:hypothetical protein
LSEKLGFRGKFIRKVDDLPQTCLGGTEHPGCFLKDKTLGEAPTEIMGTSY